MPTYSYFCEKCDTKFELFCLIKDYKEKPKCVNCKSKKTIRDYMLDASTQSASIKKNDSELKTLGDLADRNRDRLSRDTKESLKIKHNSKNKGGKLPKGMKRIDTSTNIRWQQ